MPQGILASVGIEDLGAGVTVDADAGDFVLHVDKTTELNETGGRIRIGAFDYGYTAADDTTLTVALDDDDPLLEDVAEGTPIRTLAGAEVAQEWTAMVYQDENDEPFPVVIGREWIDYFTPGDDQAGVVVTFVDDEHGVPHVAAMPDQNPPLDLSNGVNLPDPTTVAIDPPSESPAIKVTGNAAGLLVQTDPILPTTLLDFYVDGVLVAANERTTIIQLTTIDGTTPMDLSGATTYSVHTQAHNNASPDPASSSPVLGTPNPGVNSELVIGALAAAFIEARVLNIGTAMTFDGTGFTITHPDGRQTVFRSDGSGNQMIGQAVLDAVTILGSFVLEGLDNYVNGTVTAGNGVGNPTSKIAVTFDHESVTTDIPAVYSPRGLYDDGTRWIYTQSAISGNIWRITKTTGEVALVALPQAKFEPLGGAVKIGTNWYVLGKDGNRGGDWWVFVYNSSFVKTGEWTFISAPTESCTIGVDGSTIIIAKRTGVNNLYVALFTTGGASGGTGIGPIAWGSAATLTGVVKAPVDTATARYVVTSTVGIRVFNTSTGARITAEEWTPASTPICGISHDGANWHVYDGTDVWEHTNIITNQEAGYTWLDDQVGQTGYPTLAETELSPPVTVLASSAAHPAKRSRWTASLPSEPPFDGNVNGANTARIYIGPSGAGAPVLQTTLAAGDLAETYDAISTGGSAPPVANGFASRPGALGWFKSPLATWSLLGDESGQVGPWSWNPAGIGTLYNAADASSADVAPSSTANVTVPGLSLTFDSPGTGAVWMVTLCPDVLFTAAGGNAVELLVDGVAQSPPIANAGAINNRVSSSKTYRVTGLAAGSHTYTARTRSQGSYTTTVLGAQTTMLAERIA